MDQQRFLQQLQIVLDRHQGDVKAATGILQKEFYSKPESLLFLIHIVVSHENAQLKQLAAVEGRSLVSKLWLKTPEAQRPQVRTQLLQSTMHEPASLVRHASSRLISAIANVDLEDAQWPELPQLLLQASTSSRVEERAVGTYILFSVLETMAEGFTEKFNDLFTLFGRTIQDPESAEVRINTMLCLSKIAMALDSDEDATSVATFQELFPSMVKVLQDSIGSGDEDRIMQAFEVFQTVLGCDFQLIAKHFGNLIKLMNQISTNTDMAEDTRVQAISFLMSAVGYRKIRIQGLKLGEQLTLSMMQVATELGDEEDEDDITPARSALGLIDLLAQRLPASQTIVPLLHALPRFSSHQDPSYRRAGILALGMVVEGAPDFISTQVKDIMPIVLRLLDDSDAKVRGAALQAVARLADDVPEDLGKEHEKLMPMLFKNLTAAMQAYQGEEEGPNITIMKSGTSAIDAVVDGMDADDATPYLERLVPLLSKLFKHPDLKIKGLAAGALGSLASTVESAFLPYLEDSMNALQEFATKKESQEELDLRASVTDAMGEMAVAAGPEKFQHYVKPLMQASEEALHLDHSRLKESTYILWGSLAKVYEENFTPFIGGAVAGLFNCLEQDEGADLEVELGNQAKDLLGKEVTIAGKKVKVASVDDDDLPTGENGEIEDVELDEDDDDAWDDLTTVTPVALEKEIAVEVLGDILSNTKSAFLPYFEKTVENILPLCEHNYEGVRKATISTLHRAYATLCQVCEEDGKMEKWKPGLPLQVQPINEVKKLGEVVMTATLAVWAEEDDRQTVSECSRSFSETLKVAGPALISEPGAIEKVVNIVIQIITQQHACQEDLAMEEGDLSEQETTEFDWLVIDSAMDVISGLAVALGPSFGELWKIFEKSVLKYASSSESLERATAVGVLAEVITGMGDAVSSLTGKLLTLLLKRLGDEDAQVKSNAAYAIGRLVEKSNATSETFKAYPTILSKLEGLLGTQEARCMDNAAGCVSRLILKNKDAVPTTDVLPVLVNNVLPLKQDYQENEPVYNMIVQMYKWEDPTIRNLTPQLIPIFQSVMGEPEDQLVDSTRSQLEELVTYLQR
ncbi:putative importin beta-4 [Phaeomoniella chlamydospora]|uniref:Putative importin beta-4 n=1 Tax=Phaeomoniella chlamydospora TaxID=158046 RepID=A0A0G2ENR7_PHACM|nr:putative importin beta-4 [Phaeomoniella chlamydospora]